MRDREERPVLSPGGANSNVTIRAARDGRRRSSASASRGRPRSSPGNEATRADEVEPVSGRRLELGRGEGGRGLFRFLWPVRPTRRTAARAREPRAAARSARLPACSPGRGGRRRHQARDEPGERDPRQEERRQAKAQGVEHGPPLRRRAREPPLGARLCSRHPRRSRSVRPRRACGAAAVRARRRCACRRRRCTPRRARAVGRV